MKSAVPVPDMQKRSQLAALRSLGRAGYETHAAAARADAMGLKSSFARRTAVHPGYDDPAFCDWLAAYMAANDIRMIVPSGGLLAAVRTRSAGRAARRRQRWAFSRVSRTRACTAISAFTAGTFCVLPVRKYGR